jgi:hypothetical protein
MCRTEENDFFQTVPADFPKCVMGAKRISDHLIRSVMRAAQNPFKHINPVNKSALVRRGALRPRGTILMVCFCAFRVGACADESVSEKSAMPQSWG